MEHTSDKGSNIAVARERLIAAFERSLPSDFARDAELEASMTTAADFLLSHAAVPFLDIAEMLGRANSLEPTARAFVQEVAGLGLLIEHFAQQSQSLPSSDGYEPLLREFGLQPPFAKIAAQLIVRRGRREARDTLIFGDVVRAIRFLARPNQPIWDAREKIEFLLHVARETTALQPILLDAAAEHEFIRCLEAAAGQPDELTACCAKLALGLKIKRGRKVSAASVSHQFLLRHLPTDCAYTYDSIQEKFVDQQTAATRLEFGEPNFDPRPAHRRAKSASKT